MRAFDTSWPKTTAPLAATGLGLLSVVLAFGFTAGTPGVALAGAVTVVSVFLSPPVGVAFAHAGLLWVFPDGLGLQTLALVEGSLSLTLLGSLVRSPVRGRALGMGVASFVGVLGISRLTTIELGSTAAGAAVVVAGIAATMYAIHRFERVGLGLTEASDR